MNLGCIKCSYFFNIYSVTKKLEIIEKEVQQLQLLSVEQAELDNIKTNKLGIENKLQIL